MCVCLSLSILCCETIVMLMLKWWRPQGPGEMLKAIVMGNKSWGEITRCNVGHPACLPSICLCQVCHEIWDALSGSNAEGRTATSMFKMNYDILWQYVAIYGHFKQVETTARGSLLCAPDWKVRTCEGTNECSCQDICSRLPHGHLRVILVLFLFRYFSVT